MTPHPISLVDIILGVLIADGLLYALRAGLHLVSRRRNNKVVAQRVESMRPAALDSYRVRQERDPHAPLG
jgi:hypothetical protein